MGGPPRWIERSFEARVAPGLFPNVCARLRGTPARLEDVTRGLPRAVLTRSVDGGWSILANAGHLADLEPLTDARLTDFLAGRRELTPWDGTNEGTDRAGHDARPLGDVLAEFRRVRAALMERIDALTPADFERTALHPRLQQEMRLIDLLVFLAEHDDHHLARIWELARGPIRYRGNLS